MERGKLMMKNEQPADAPRCLTLNPPRPFRLRLRFRAFGPPPPSSCSLWLNHLRRFRLRVGVGLRPSHPPVFSAFSAVKSAAFGAEPQMPSTLLWPMGASGERSPRRCDPTSLTRPLTLNPTPTSNSLGLLRVGVRSGGFFRALCGEFKFIPAMTL